MFANRYTPFTLLTLQAWSLLRKYRSAERTPDSTLAADPVLYTAE